MTKPAAWKTKSVIGKQVIYDKGREYSMPAATAHNTSRKLPPSPSLRLTASSSYLLPESGKT